MTRRLSWRLANGRSVTISRGHSSQAEPKLPKQRAQGELRDVVPFLMIFAD